MTKFRGAKSKLIQFLILLLLPFMVSAAAHADPYVDGYEAYNDGDYQRAISIWTQAANMGQHGSMSALQGLYENGAEGWDDIPDFQPDPVKARYWREKAEAQHKIDKDLEEIYFRAVDAHSKRDFFAATKDLKIAVEGGNDHAMILLGMMYYYGEGVPESQDLAAYWAQKAYDRGNIFAATQLGLYYFEGSGVAKSYAKALEYLRESEERNQSEALVYLGLMYANGAGVSVSYDRAMAYFKRAADSGLAEGKQAYADFKLHVADYKRRQADVAAYNRGVDEYNAKLKRDRAARDAQRAAQQQQRSSYQYKSWTTNYNVPSTPFGSSANAQKNWARYNCNLSGGRVGC